MKAEITVTRTPGEIPHNITLSVELDKDGDVFALPVETVYRRMREFIVDGYSEWTDYDRTLAVEGFPFELEPEEIEEAKKAIASNQAAYEKQTLRDLSFLSGGPSPLAGLSPHEEGK